MSREWAMLAQIVDDGRQHQQNATGKKRRIKEWPRPWPAPGVVRLGKKTTASARDVLRRMAGRG